MTFSFDIALSQKKDQVRQRIGDVDSTNPQVEDEAIAFYLNQGLSVLRAAIRLCYDIAARYAPIADVNMDRQLSQTGQIYQHYIDLAKQLESEARTAAAGQGDASTGGAVLVGGLSDCRGPIDYDWNRF